MTHRVRGGGRSAHPQWSSTLAPENLGTSRQADNLANHRHDTAPSRLDPIRIRLRICRTLAVAARTQLRIGDGEVGEFCAAESERSYSVVAKLLPAMAFGEERQGFQMELNNIREMLDQLPRLGN